MFFIMNNDIIYIKHNIKKSVFKFMKRVCDVEEKVREHTHNTAYL